MGETAEQIRNQIDAKREELGANLSNLERRVRDLADWRKQVSNRPMTAIGTMFGVGLLMSLMLRRGHRRSHR